MTMTLYQIVAVAFIEDVLLISTPPPLLGTVLPVQFSPQGVGLHKALGPTKFHIGCS